MGLLQSSGSRLIRKPNRLDPHANNVVLFLRGDLSSLATTTTTANFTVPAVNSTVVINVVSSAWAAANRAIRIGNGAGNYIVTAIPNGTQITIRNCGGVDNAVAGSVINSGATIALSIIDSSGSPKTISSFGNTQLEIDNLAYNNSAIRFDGSGDYLRLPLSSDFDFAPNVDFTIELFSKFYSLPSSFTIFSRALDNDDRTLRLIVVSGVLWVATWNVVLISWTHNFVIGQRYHIAVVRSGSNLRLFINGIQRGSTYVSSSLNFSNFTNFEFGGSPLQLSKGISDSNSNQEVIRITRGIGRYTTNFNPETDTYLY